MNFSIWEHNHFLTADVVIIGAGITGLSTAASIKEKRPELKVIIIERGILPTGASTKNAGFACFGSVSELKEDLDKMGTQGMTDLVDLRWKGLNKTRNRLLDESIDYHQFGGYELLFKENDESLDNLSIINESLLTLFGQEVFQDYTHQLPCFHFGPQVNHLIRNELEGQLDTGKLVSSLWNYCMGLGVKIYTGSRVTHVEQNRIIINGSIPISTTAIALCTNAFTKELANVDLKPGRGIVLAVRPKKPLSFRGNFHYDQGFYYFRNYHDLLIIGGGRNLDFESEETTFFGFNETILHKLNQDIREMIIPNNGYEVIHQWSGIMAFGEVKSPIIQELENGIFVGVRLGGMGVAIGSMVGEILASKIINARF